MLDEATGDGARVDAAELALLQWMGLPTAFSSTKARSRDGAMSAVQVLRTGPTSIPPDLYRPLGRPASHLHMALPATVGAPDPDLLSAGASTG